MNILTIGGATQDIFICYENPQMLELYSKQTKKIFLIFKKGSKIEIDDLSYHTGGGATNTATSFSRLGFDVSTICKTGDDPQADLVIKKLKQEGVNTSHMTKSTTLHTGTSIIIPSISGDRTVLAYRGSNTELKKEEIPEEVIKNCDHIYITSLSGESSKLLPYITETAKKHNKPIAINPGVSQLAAGATELRESLSNIDIFILNSDEANEFMNTLVQLGKQLKCTIKNTKNDAKQKDAPKLLQSAIIYEDICFSLHNYFHEILKRGPKIVVITDGEEGVYVATKDQILFHPSIQTDVVSTLGAGDSFGSCFAASLWLGDSLEQAMVHGIINSSSVISHLDAKTGLLERDALLKKAKKVTTKSIIRLPLKP